MRSKRSHSGGFDASRLIFGRAYLIWRANPEPNPSEAMADDPATMPDPDVTVGTPADSAAAEAAAARDDRAAALAAEVADLKDKLLRTLAEMENLRRRTEREVADSRQYAVTSFARDMLVVGRQSPARHRGGAGGSASGRPGARQFDGWRRGNRARARADADQIRRPPDRRRRARSSIPACTRRCTRSRRPIRRPARSPT